MALETLSRLLYGAILAGTVLLSAWWLARITAPRPVAALPSADQEAPGIRGDLIHRLFGGGMLPASSVEGLRLSGIFLRGEGGGFATFGTSKGAAAAFVGDEIIPGVTLKRIEAGRVLVLAGGMERELRLFNGQPPAPGIEQPTAPRR